MDGYPYVSAFKDKQDTWRYRFRRGGKSFYLPESPGHPKFEESYRAALEGREPVTRQRKGPAPGSFADAWRLVQRSAKWRAYDVATISKNEALTKLFLRSRIVPDAPDTWGEMLVSDLKRRHVKMILADYSETPHKAKHILTAIRRLVGEALDQEWIEYDPTLKIGWRPDYTGWRAWTIGERKSFEARWPYGTMPRAAYALALWAGMRRSDVAAQKWKDVDMEGNRIVVRPIKGDTKKVLILPMLPMLRKAIEPLGRRADTVITTEYGKPFSEKSLTGMMAHWTKLAGMEAGATFHGLRKTLGKYLAEEGATAKQSAGILGHDDLEHVELYSREAEQERLAADGLSKLMKYDV